MKKFLIIPALLFILSPLYAARLNPELSQMLLQYQQGAPSPDQGAGPGLPRQALPEAIMVWGSGDPNAVVENGGQILNSHYPFFTARIPMNRLAGFQQEARISFLNGGQKAHTLLNLAVPAVKADQNYAAGYKGDDVIIGIIDDSCDPYHGDFYNANGMSRFLYIWDQFANGVPPALFSYGHEWSKSDIDNKTCNIINTNYDGKLTTHGVHVTGIASGDGSWSDGLYRGVSPQANLIMVRTEGYLYQIINAVEYIFWQSKRLGKPCVINISMGFHFGNHRNDDPFNQYLETILEHYGKEGHIVVWAGGNEAQFPLHTTNRITSSPSEINFTNSFSGTSFSFYYDSPTIIPVAVLQGGLTNISFTTTGVNTPQVQMEITNYINNNKLVNLYIKIPSQSWKIVFGTSANNIVVNGYVDNFIDYYGKYNGVFLNPISRGTLSTSCGWANSISVASYTIRTVYTNYLGNPQSLPTGINGEISVFSSQGPTPDGQQKPEIAAPGEAIISTMETINWVSDEVVVPHKYMALQGTSMAAPMVTGIVAQMLELDPTLTVDEVKALLKTYAMGNAYKTDPGVWDPSYGYGLVDASGILSESVAGQTIQFSVKNNVFKPSAGQDNLFFFQVKSVAAGVSQDVSVNIYNGRGGLVYSYASRSLSGVGVSEYEWNGTDQTGVPVPTGLYFILVQTGSSTQRFPVLVVQ